MNNLEKLCEDLMNDWTTGTYTKAYNDYDALLSGREMREIFIDKALKMVDVTEQREVIYVADHLQEAIDEGIANMQ